MSNGKRSSNDQRSDAHNSTSKEHKDAQDNRSRQLDSNQPEYEQSRGDSGKSGSSDKAK
jgi:hypothetical protein